MRFPPGAEDDGAVGLPACTGLSRHGGDDLSHDCRAFSPVRQRTLVPAAMTTANQYISIYKGKQSRDTYTQNKKQTNTHAPTNTFMQAEGQ